MKEQKKKSEEEVKGDTRMLEAGKNLRSGKDSGLMKETKFRWNNECMELEIIEPQHPTYVPFSGNRCWALLPTNLDWFCYVVDIPIWLRILKRIGFYVQVGKKRGSLLKVLENLRTFYGANYLRLTGQTENVLFEIKVFPDVEQSILYIVASAENMTSTDKDIKIMVAADFQFHSSPWACKGFTEDATSDYSGLGRKVNIPKDDKIKAEKNGSIFFVYDGKNPGVGFIASKKPNGWTLDRSKFSFETPMSGYRPNRAEEASDILDLSNEERSDDSLCVFQHNIRLQPRHKEIMPIVIGYQIKEDSRVILDTLEKCEEAFEKTKNFYQAPLIKGVKVETPDPTINAQFNLFNIFVKMNEHRCGTKHAFIPGAHHYNWLADDFFFAIMGYAYTNDLKPIADNVGLFKDFQHKDGFVPNLPLWTNGTAGRKRPFLPIFCSISYILGACHLIKFMRDRKFATEIFPSLRKAVDVVLGCTKEGLISPEGVHGFDAIDWPCGFGFSPQTYASVETYKSLVDLSALAVWLDDHRYAEELLRKARKLRGTINEKLWMEKRGYYRIGLPVGKVGRDADDRRLFYQDMISWGSIAAVLWEVADEEKAVRAVENVKKRLFTPYGLKFYEPPWVPSYTDADSGITYEAGRCQNGAYWHCWHSISSLVKAEIMVGKTEQAFKDFLEIRLDNIYSRFTMREKGKDLHFLRCGEWTDTDLTFPVTSIPYMLTAAMYNQTLLEDIIGIKVGYNELQIQPHLPSSWNYAKVANLKIGNSEWAIEIHGRGEVEKILLDGVEIETIPITPGKHQVDIALRQKKVNN